MNQKVRFELNKQQNEMFNLFLDAEKRNIRPLTLMMPRKHGLTFMKKVFDKYVEKRSALIGFDPGIPGGDKSCFVYGRMGKDGNIEITDVKFYEPKKNKRGFWEASWLSVRDRCSRIANRVLTMVNEKRLH